MTAILSWPFGHSSKAQEVVNCITAVDADAYIMGLSNAKPRNKRVLDLSNEISKLAVTVHIVRESNGTGGVSEDLVLNEIETTNDFFSPVNLGFYIDEIRYVNNSDLYDYDLSQEEILAGSRDVDNTINLYFVERIGFGGGEACGYAYLPNQELDRIVISESCGLDGNTVAHEFGHYFNLIHTHGQVNVFGFTDELVDGSNCDITGDLICDTPADPMLLDQVNDNCVYTGDFRDDNGQNYNPDTRNLLSYSLGTCRTSLSDGQYKRIRNAYENSRTDIKLKPVLAGFDSEANVVCRGDQIQFSDQSVGATEWSWFFEGGSPSVSNLQNPLISFNQTGVFDVKLEVSSNGITDVLLLEDYISVRAENIGSVTVSQNFEPGFDQFLSEKDGDRYFEINSEYSFNSTQSLWINLFQDPNLGSKDRVFTSTINGQAQEYLIQFDLAYAQRNALEDKLILGFQKWCNPIESSLFEIVGSELSTSSPISTEFLPQNEDWLSKGFFFQNPFPGEVARLFIETQSAGGNNLFLDNIRIRPRKAIDADSLVLVSIQDALDGQIPWDMSKSIADWEGVTVSEEDRVIGLDFGGFGMVGTLPDELSSLDQLRTLTLDGNQFGLSNVLTQLTNLESLSIVGNMVSSLPNDWSQLAALREVDLRNNEITTLPNSLTGHDGISVLNVRNNNLNAASLQGATLSNTLNVFDISANNLSTGPLLNLENSTARLNLSQNDLSLDELFNSSNVDAIYSPQNLFGIIEYYDTQSPIQLTCPIPIGTNTIIEWYRDNSLMNGADQVQLNVTDLSAAYYQCKAIDARLSGIRLNSRPYLINTSETVCQQNLSGTYDVATTYRDKDDLEWQLTDQLELTATANQIYQFSDLSFGVNQQVHNIDALAELLQFDCGDFFTPSNLSYTHQVLSTTLDLDSEEITISWTDEQGGKGVSVLSLNTPGLSNRVEILDFEFDSQSAPASINSFDGQITVVVGCSQFSNVPFFSLSPGARAYVNNELQTSGVSAQDFAEPVKYTIFAEDGVTFKDWTVTLVEQPKDVLADISVVNQTFCSPVNGSVKINDITVDGVSRILSPEEFDITWSTDINFSSILSNGLDITTLDAGSYYLRISEKASGCGVVYDNIIVEEDTPIGQLSFSDTGPDRSCGGVNTGFIESEILGLSSSLVITWQMWDNGQWLTLSNYDGLLDIGQLSSGLYRQLVLDNVTGCSYEQQTTISNIEAIIEATVSINANTDCSNPSGSIIINTITQDDVDVGLTSSNYSIAWYSDIQQQNLIGTDLILDGLVAGTYFMQLTNDQLLCESNLYSLFVPSNTLNTEVSLSTKVDNTSCTDQPNGTLGVNIGGLTDGYNFEWYRGSNISGLSISDSPNPTGLDRGTYTVKVISDAGAEQGCFSTLTTSLFDNLEDIEIQVASSPVTSCVSPNGTLELLEMTVDGTVRSATGAYDIQWSLNSSFNEVFSHNSSITGVSPGRYFCRVVNSITGCTSNTRSVEVRSSFLSINPSFQTNNNTNCTGPFSGSINLLDLDPIDDYEVSWYNQEPNETTNSISSGLELVNLRSGTYYTIVRHKNSGCQKTYSHIIGDVLLEPLVEVVVSHRTNCSSPDGSIEIVQISEGGIDRSLADYEVEWSLEETFSDLFQSELLIMELEERDYFLRVKNKSTGCYSEVKNYTINDATVYPEIGLEGIKSEKPALGELGQIEVSIDYNGDYELEWFDLNSQGSTPIGREKLLSSVGTGSYRLDVTSDKGCTAVEEFEVTLDSRSLQSIEFNIPTEVYQDLGQIDLMSESTSGQSVDYELISGPGRIFQNELQLLGEGIIEIQGRVAEDNNYFSAIDTHTIVVLPPISVTVNVQGTLSGIATLYNSSWQLYDQITFTNSQVVFEEIEPNDYYLEIVPSGFLELNAITTYYPDVFKPEDAELLLVDKSVVVDFSVIEISGEENGLPVTGAIGTKNGNSLLTVGEIIDLENPQNGLKFYLIDILERTVVAVASSGFRGDLIFEQVPPGDYELYLSNGDYNVDLSSIVLSIDSDDDSKVFTLELGDNGEIEIVIISGIDEWGSGELEIYPNPTQQDIQIRFEAPLVETVTCRLYDLTGALLESAQIIPGTLNHQIDLNQYRSSTYLIQLTDSQGTVVRKVIKH